MIIKDLEYQNQAVSGIISHYKLNPLARVMLVMPTGTGKTIVIRKLIVDPEFISTLLEGKDRDYIRVVYKCHLERLLTQAKRRFDAHLVDESTIENWLDPEYKNKKQVEVCYQMYSGKIPEDADIDIIIYDECQHEACNTIQEFLSTAGKYPSLGVTATPERSDNCLLKFDSVVEPLTRKEAVDQGYICHADINTIVDTSNSNKANLLKDVLFEFDSEMKRVMIFVRTKKEISEVVNFINKNLNQLARGCDGDVDMDEILDSYGAGDFKYLVSCNKLSEGIDVQGVTDIIIAKNVGSNIMLNQIIGRGSRIDIDECRVWEFVNALSDNNLDSTDVVGIPRSHRIINKVNGKFLVRDFM